MAVVIESGTMEWKRLREGLHVRTVMGDFITAQIVRIDKGATTPIHRHVQEQIGYIIEGRARFFHGDKGESVTVESGMFVFFASNEAHGLQEVPEDTVILDIFGPAREDYVPLAVSLRK